MSNDDRFNDTSTKINIFCTFDDFIKRKEINNRGEKQYACSVFNKARKKQKEKVINEPDVFIEFDVP